MEVITLVISVPGFAATMFAIGSTFSALIGTLTETVNRCIRIFVLSDASHLTV